MPRQRFTPEQIIGKLREVEVAVARGATISEACRGIGVSEQTLYRWRREYGGMKVDQAKRLKELEVENARLKKLVADLSLDKAILKEAAKVTFQLPPVAATALSRSAKSSGYPSGGPVRSSASTDRPSANA
jgi:transposase-like protein